MTPQRIQLSRRKGFRKPEGAVVVARPSRWGNPFKILPNAAFGGWKVIGNSRVTWSDDAPFSREEALRIAVDLFRDYVPIGSMRHREFEIALEGKDLACWCKLDTPCHADVLLSICNLRRTTWPTLCSVPQRI